MPKKKTSVIIPSRMASTRFPGKPLIDIMGLPMIEHVRRRACLCDSVDDVYVATCDEEIKQVTESYGGKAIMTADTHERCTDRIEEAAASLDSDIVVNVQGDEPLVLPESIVDVARPLQERDDVLCTCLIYHINNTDDLNDINMVKAVLDPEGWVLYFSRAPIPFLMGGKDRPMREQSGIMAYRKDFLHAYSRLAPTPLEIAESVDMLRILEHGHRVLGVVTEYSTKGVNIPEDVPRMVKALTEDPRQRELYERVMAWDG